MVVKKNQKEGREENRQTECRKGLFKRKDIRPESFDFSASKENDSRRMRIRVTDGNKEFVLNMDEETVFELFSGIMNNAPETFGLEPVKKVRDIMYA